MDIMERGMAVSNFNLANNNSNGKMTFEEYSNYLDTHSVRESIYKVEMLNKVDDTVEQEISGSVENNSGSISISNNEGCRRSANITLSNFNQDFTDYFANITLGSRFKIYLGHKINNIEYLFSQGVFIYTDPTLNSDLSNKTISLSGNDKWSLLNGDSAGILDATYQVEKGTSLGSFVARTLQLDIVRDYVNPNIDKSIFNAQTTYDIIHEAGETVADVISEVAFNLSAYVYYDENGVFTMKPFVYDSELPIIHSYDSLNDINYLTATKTQALSSVYNAVLLVAENIQDELSPIRSYLENNDPSDGNSIINGNSIKVYNVTEYVNGIDTQQKADERVRYELKKVASMQSNISLESLSLYHFVENNIITVTDKFLGSIIERFLIVGIDFSIGSDSSMSLSVVKARKYL